MFKRLKLAAYRFLRRGERYTGTDNVYLAKGGFFLSFASFIASASSLILAILFARLVSKEAYGTYQYLLSWGSIFAISSVTGMSDALTRAVAQRHDGTIYPVLKTRLRWSMIGLAIGASVGAYYLARGRVDLCLGILMIAAFFPTNSALSSWSDYALGKKAFALQTRLAIAISLATAVSVFTAVLVRPTALFLAFAFSASYLLANGLALLYVLRKLPPNEAPADDTVGFGKKLTLLDFISSISTYLDRILVFTLLGSRETAVYAFALAPPEQVKGYLKNLYFMALPKIAARPLQEMKKTFFRKFFILLAAIGGVILAYVLAAPLFYRLLFPAYAEAAGYSMLFAISLFGVASVLPVAIFNGHKRYEENLMFQAATSLVGIGTLAIFVWKWGLLGAVLARVFTRFFGLAYSIVLVRSVFKEASPTPPPSHSPDSAAPAEP